VLSQLRSKESDFDTNNSCLTARFGLARLVMNFTVLVLFQTTKGKKVGTIIFLGERLVS